MLTLLVVELASYLFERLDEVANLFKLVERSLEGLLEILCASRMI